MAKIRLLVVGAGGYGRTVAEAAELSGVFEIVGFLETPGLPMERSSATPCLVKSQVRSTIDPSVIRPSWQLGTTICAKP